MTSMQFGLFTVGDVTPDPVNQTTQTEHERIKNTITIAKKAEEIGLDVFATGEHHNPPFVTSSPTTTLAYTFKGVSIVFVMLLMRGGVAPGRGAVFLHGLDHLGSKVTGTSMTLSTGRPFSSAALRTAASLGPS